MNKQLEILIQVFFFVLFIQRCWAGDLISKEISTESENQVSRFEKSCNGCKHYTFEIITGRGAQVCNSYKAALESIAFSKPPYCDHMDFIKGNGIEALDRERLGFDEVQNIYSKIKSFYLNSNQYYSEKRGKPYGYQNEVKARKFYKTQHVEVLKIVPPVDITGDGKNDQLLIWKEWRCSEQLAERIAFFQGAYFMNDAYSNVDEEKTRLVFGHPEPFELIDRFRFIGPSINLFQYDDTIFFDTWPLGYFRNQDKRDNIDIQVYMHRGGATALICELSWKERS